MSRQEITIGLFGFGVVGKGLWDVLEQTPGLKANIRKICVKNHDKPRPISTDHFTFEKNDLLDDKSINVIVELIDDPEAAFEIVTKAMQNGKGVVSANKKMIADHLEELLEMQKKYEVPFLYEASCCASIPIIRNLEEYYDNDLLVSLEGIVNGSTNYILTRTSEDKISYEQALQLAREKGYVESNPALDVEGFDAKYKLIILLLHAFGIVEQPENIFNLGIQRLGALELRLAAEKGYKIKLIALARKLENDKVIAFVMPQFVNPASRFYTVDDVFNGVQTETSFADKQFFIGRGAGAFPTASAVLSDISALSYNYRYEYKKMSQESLSLSNDFSIEVFVRFQHKDEVPTSDFISITEKYRSADGHYIVGRIGFDKMIKCSWAQNPGVSILLTPAFNAEPYLHKEQDALKSEGVGIRIQDTKSFG
ncbi:MAG: homoserine dehydrogenase [Bacteroidales bacterium]|nr:homoserine dehydrogenase [Bacteroidales bacterium]